MGPLARAQSCPPPGDPPPESSRPARYGPPAVKPACIDATGHAKGCKPGELAAYNKAIDPYNAAVTTFNGASQTYADAMNQFSQRVHDYTHCEFDILNGKTG